MTVHICSLITDESQLVRPGAWTTLRFPFGTAESYDKQQMHQVAQPVGAPIDDWQSDDRSGLIWPSTDGWGVLNAMVQWEAGGYEQLGARFVRDPLKLTTGWDATATDERPPTPGAQRSAYTWQMFVHPGTPIAVQVYQDDKRSRRMTFAELKLAIHTTAQGS